MRYWKCITTEDGMGFTVGRTYTTDIAGQRFVDDTGFMYNNDIRTLLGVVFEEMVYN